MQEIDRRTLIELGGITTATGLAGCTSGFRETTTERDTAEAPTTTTDEPTTTTGSTAPPGADVLGGPDDLHSSATVTGTTLESDRGAGQYVFTPAVVWVAQDATVEWTIDTGSHTITAYHDANGQSTRVPDGATAFDSGVLASGETFEHTFSTPGVHNYYCTPHRGLGMTGVVIVQATQGGPGASDPTQVQSDAEATALSRQLQAAGLDTADPGGDEPAYAWFDATLDSYWYSLYNMSTNIAMNGNGVQFPHNDQQQAAFDRRVPAMLQAADVDEPPIANPNLNMAPFTEGDPHFTEKPVFDVGDSRPDASTLAWDVAESSKTVSPASVAWSHLKGVTWAKNFEAHFDVLPPALAAKFRAQMLTTLAQIGVNATLVAGGPDGNGALTKGESLELVSGFKPGTGAVTDATARPNHHTAMVWFLSNLNSLAQNDWFGYVNPEPLVPAKKIQALTDGLAKTTMNAFDASTIASMGSTRDLGQALGAAAWYGTQASSDELRSTTVDWANALAAELAANLDGSGKVGGGGENQAATQGAVAQGLAWASELEGVDHLDLAESVVGYLANDLHDPDSGTFASNAGDATYRYTVRDVGDVTGGLNAADAVLDMDVGPQYASFFDQTLNRGRLQRAERPPSRDEAADHTLPLPPAAGGGHGQAAVSNQAVEYDTETDEWSVADDRFVTADALYAANQELWISHWNGDFYEGRGIPGRTETPPQ